MRSGGFCAAAAAALLCGCATKAASIAPSYVSPLMYQNLTCEQLAMEAQSVSSRAAVAAGAQDKKVSQDAVAMTVGVIVFWPALFLTQGDGQTAAEVARLKGEMEAIEKASIGKNCGVVFDKAPQAPAKTASAAT